MLNIGVSFIFWSLIFRSTNERPKLSLWFSLFWIIAFIVFLSGDIPRPAWVTIQAILAIVLAVAENTDEVLG